MELRNAGQLTMVVTTTPSGVHGLEHLNEAIDRGYRIRHVASLGYTEPGIDDRWPEGHFSTLFVLGVRDVRTCLEGARYGAEQRPMGGPAIDRLSGSPPPVSTWSDHAI